MATKALMDFGLVAGGSGPQPGIGAAHTIFSFDNAYLEFAWSASGVGAFEEAPDHHFVERTNWEAAGWYPFGVVRPRAASPDRALACAEHKPVAAGPSAASNSLSSISSPVGVPSRMRTVSTANQGHFSAADLLEVLDQIVGRVPRPFVRFIEQYDHAPRPSILDQNNRPVGSTADMSEHTRRQ